MEYSPELNQLSAPYPGATIFQTTNVSGTVMVVMESNDSLDSIFHSYKKELVANGWTISAENREQGHSGLIGEKESNNAVVNISTGQSGKSTIMLMLAPQQ